jgi:hypothetical protein
VRDKRVQLQDACFTLLGWEAPPAARLVKVAERLLESSAASSRRCRSRRRCSYKLPGRALLGRCCRSARSASCDDAAPRRGHHLTAATSSNKTHWRDTAAPWVRAGGAHRPGVSPCTACSRPSGRKVVSGQVARTIVQWRASSSRGWRRSARHHGHTWTSCLSLFRFEVGGARRVGRAAGARTRAGSMPLPIAQYMVR